MSQYFLVICKRFSNTLLELAKARVSTNIKLHFPACSALIAHTLYSYLEAESEKFKNTFKN